MTMTPDAQIIPFNFLPVLAIEVMSPSLFTLANVSLWIISGILTELLIYIIYIRLKHPLSHVPPLHWSVKWFNGYNTYAKYTGSIRLALYDAHLNLNRSNLSPVIRTGLNEISVMTSEGVKTVFGGDFERTSWYSVFSNFGLVPLSPLPNMYPLT